VRIVSLVPSVTETLVAWGTPPIACTRFCEQPGLDHVGGTKDPAIERIVALAPDVVVMDEEENRIEDYRSLLGAGVRVEALAVRAIADVGPALVRLAALAGTEPPDDTGGAPAADPPTRLRAFVPIWRRPWMALGQPTYGASLLAALGVATVPGDAAYASTELEAVAAGHPDVVLAPSEPYPFTSRQLPELESVAPTVFVDGKDLFWWGVRTEGARARLAELVASIP
jgi:ABC-type Fe3+-hydroxamate transport system substrate-binding protein